MSNKIRKSGSLEFGEEAPGLIRQIVCRDGFDPEISGVVLSFQEDASAADYLYRRGYISYSKVKTIEKDIAYQIERLIRRI